MKKHLLAIAIFFILAVLITGFVVKPLTPLLFGGKTFDNRSDLAQSLLISASITFTFFLLFFIYLFLVGSFFSDHKFDTFLDWISSITKPFSKSTKFSFLISSFLIIFAAIFLFVQIKLITFPYSLEFAEGSIQLTTYALLNRINPYSLENNYLYINVYGIGYHLLVLPFAAILGNTLSVHRLVNFLCILGILVIVIRVMIHKKNSLQVTIIAALFICLGLLFNVTPTARPDSLGVLLFLLMICIPYLKKFNNQSLLISSLLGLFSFYTKIYFILGIPILASYLFFFISKKKGILYGIGTLALILFSSFVVNLFFEAYFSNTLRVFFSGGTSSNFFFLVKQSTKFIRDYWGLFIIGLIALYQYFKDSKNKKLIIDYKNFNGPFIKNDFDIMLYAFIICGLAVFLRMGWHTGTNQTYFYHLLTPFLVISILSHIDEYRALKSFFLIVLIINLCTQSFENLLPDFSDFNLQEWKTLENHVTGSKKILNSPLETSILIAQEMDIHYSFFSYYYFLYPKNESFFWPGPEQLQRQADLYLTETADLIKSGGFDTIIRNANKNYGFFVGRLDENLSNEAFLEKYYHTIESLVIDLPHTKEVWNIDVMKPN